MVEMESKFSITSPGYPGIDNSSAVNEAGLLMPAACVFISTAIAAQVDDPIGPDAARNLVRSRFKESFDLGSKIFAIDKYDFYSDAVNQQTTCPPKFSRNITKESWHIKENFADFIQ